MNVLFRSIMILTLCLPAIPLEASKSEKRRTCQTQTYRKTFNKKGAVTDCDGTGTIIKNEYALGDIFTITVVVHVIHASDGTGQLSESKIMEMMDILNQDFRNVGAMGNDVGINFQMATLDPDGSPTNGITYTQNDAWFSEATEAVRAQYGAALTWDPDRYLNIFITGIQDALGYVVNLPWDTGGSPDEEGVTMAYDAVGTGQIQGAEEGHTITHEVGHYLGLEHTFGNDGSCATGDCYQTGDFICDTNPHLESQGGCSDQMSCDEPEPIHNYMNYTDDVCLSEFTTEQINRMRCSLINYRSALLQTTTTQPNELPSRWITHVTRNGGDFKSTLFLQNHATSQGSLTITAFDAEGHRIDNAELQETLSANEFKTLDLETSLPFADLSHLGLSGSDQITATVAYQVSQGTGASAHLNEQSLGATRYFLFPGETDLVFDGLAVLNVGEANAAVTLRQKNRSGSILSTSQISDGLAPGAKHLAILSVEFGDVSDSVIEITSTQPVLVVALRGTQPGSEVTYLYQTEPVKGR